ncbi:hypothetical protein G6F51_014546 [Rhizopus arrhizus]|uniref:FAD/NAD(P)-binding domain-containing protein n=1 Tax=Rhizopus oryzae TaxID=64495 RepID=A0A9P7BYI9_RHIOR|nr:hypothetical protein G6F51_014546 [Rhizopus arrhizus]
MKAPLQPIFDAVGVHYLAGRVEHIDVANQQVQVVGHGADAASQTLHYDRLVLAAGSRLNCPPIPGLQQHAFNVDQNPDAAR